MLLKERTWFEHRKSRPRGVESCTSPTDNQRRLKSTKQRRIHALLRILSLLAIQSVGAQFTYQVQFPTINDKRDQPYVDCYSSGLPRPAGSCSKCDANYNCINTFQIQTVSFDAFTSQTTDITDCRAVDPLTGKTVDLNLNVFQIVLTSQAPTFAAPQGVTLSGLGNNLQVGNTSPCVSHGLQYQSPIPQPRPSRDIHTHNHNLTNVHHRARTCPSMQRRTDTLTQRYKQCFKRACIAV